MGRHAYDGLVCSNNYIMLLHEKQSEPNHPYSKTNVHLIAFLNNLDVVAQFSVIKISLIELWAQTFYFEPH